MRLQQHRLSKVSFLRDDRLLLSAELIAEPVVPGCHLGQHISHLI